MIKSINYNRPVIIWLKGANEGTHYVVGYGLKRGASRDSLQPDQIMVYNPDEKVEDIALIGGMRTLQEMMYATISWRNFGKLMVVKI